MCVCNILIDVKLLSFFLLSSPFLNLVQGAVTESVGSLPTKTPTFSGDASGDVLMCTCRTQFELLNKLSRCCTVVADVFGVFLQNHVADLFLMTILDMEIIQENFYYS